MRMTEQEQIKEAFEDLLKSLRKDTPKEGIQQIKKAFEFADEAHKGVRRRSGEPYIMHPLAVAKIATKEIGLGTTSVVAALLHDVVEDTDYTVEDIANLFGAKVASIVDGLTKISGVMGSDTSQQAESFRKMILTLADDVRVILIKIADRLHNMRTLASMPEHKQVKIASETLYIYAPLAHRMGLHAIKTELEDLSMKYEHPEEYQVIAKKIEAYKNQFSSLFEEFIKPIRGKLGDNGYEYTITARTKSVYSVWLKMQRRNISFDEIYDLLAVRIVFKPKEGIPEKQQCWNIYALITDLYSPKPERIRDWVSVPKANGYEALHLTVMGPEGQWFEVQIRSERMDEVAEKGLAAHWKYKGEGESSELDKWLANIKEVLDQPDATALEFLDEFKLNLFTKEIRVFTPKGYMRTLPKGATALDFAYDIHSEVGDTCIGAKVNHKLVPMSYKLSSGDQVEILTSDKQKPQREWLDFVVTAKARTHINAAFKKERKEMMRNGINTYEAVVKKLGMPPTSEPLNKALKHYGLINRDDLYVEIGKHNITPEDLEKALKKRSENKFIKYWNLQFLWNGKDSDEKKKGAASQVVDDSDFSIAPCCNPVPGDDVLGYVNDNETVTIHKIACPVALRLKSSFGERLVVARWKEAKAAKPSLVSIEISGIDTKGILNQITTQINNIGTVDIRSINMEAKDGLFYGKIGLTVHSVQSITEICNNLKKIKEVKSATRINQAKTDK